MFKITREGFLSQLRLTREFLFEIWLTVFSPRRLDALRSDQALALDIQRRWSDHSIKVWCLIYERDDWRRFRESQHKPGGSLKEPDPSKRDFVVFLDPGFSIDWITEGDTEVAAASLIATAESVAAVDCDFLKPSKLLEFRIQLGHAIVCALQGEVEEGQKLVVQAQQYLAKRTVERSREWTLFSLLFVGLVVGLSMLFWGRAAFAFESVNILAVAALSGFAGAFSSMAARTGKESWDAAAGMRLHLLEVAIRLVVGLIFGVVAYCLASSSFGPEPIQKLVSTWQGCLVLSFGAGLFEHSIPRILSQYSRDQAIGILDDDGKESDSH